MKIKDKQYWVSVKDTDDYKTRSVDYFWRKTHTFGLNTIEKFSKQAHGRDLWAMQNSNYTRVQAHMHTHKYIYTHTHTPTVYGDDLKQCRRASTSHLHTSNEQVFFTTCSGLKQVTRLSMKKEKPHELTGALCPFYQNLSSFFFNIIERQPSYQRLQFKQVTPGAHCWMFKELTGYKIESVHQNWHHS